MFELIAGVLNWLLTDDSIPQLYKLIGVAACLAFAAWYFYFITTTAARRGRLLGHITEDAERLGVNGKAVRAAIGNREKGACGAPKMRDGDVRELAKHVGRARAIVNGGTKLRKGVKLWRKIIGR